MTEPKHIPDRVQGQPNFDRLSPLFVAHCDYTYRVFEDFELGEMDLTQSIFTGSLWRRVRSSRTTFARCDFDGMQIERCEFDGADFSNVDIRSTAFAGCHFRRCQFDGALIDTCSFDNCVFDECSFESAVQRASTYSGCDLLNLSMPRSSVTKCRYDESRMHRLMLADCTFLYVIVRRCRLTDVTFNVESVGTIFGISRPDLEEIRFVHLGRVATPTESEDLADLLLRTFESQRWLLSLAVTRINFGLTSVAFAIGAYIDEAEREVQAGRRPRYEELAFWVDVFSTLFEDHRLPLVSLSQFADMLQAIGRPAARSADKRLSADTIRDLTARTSGLVQSALDRLADSVGVLDLTDDRTLYVECRYEGVPGVDLPSLLEQVSRVAGLPMTRVPVRTAQRTGSYIEVIQACLATAFGLQILLYALNGMVIQLTELKERVRVLRHRRAPEAFQVLARTGRQPLPAALRQPVRRIVGFASSHELMLQPDLGGLGDRNLKEVQIAESLDEISETD